MANELPISFEPEDLISEHVCASLHPAVSINPFGNAGVVWHDARNGIFEIYFRAIYHPFPVSATGATSIAVDPGSCDNFYDSTGRKTINCNPDASSRLPGSNLDSGRTATTLRVDISSRSISLIGIESDKFITEGVNPGRKVAIENGLNAGKTLSVSRVLTETVLELVYSENIVPDSDFIYSFKGDSSSEGTCEIRLTCNNLPSTFPDIQADNDGRFHIVYQEGDSEKEDLYYIQMYPAGIGELKCQIERNLNISFENGFPNTYSSESIKYFSFGSADSFELTPSKIGGTEKQTGFHRLFLDSDGSWTGVSNEEDYVLWQEQVEIIGAPIPDPTYVAPANHPIVKEGDFGSKFDFKDIAFISESSKTDKISISSVVLPIKPKCTPSNIPIFSGIREQDLIPAPKIKAPLNFSDPIDLSTLETTTDDLPNRFMIENDNTVYTNTLIKGDSGLARLVYKKEDVGGGKIKFILGQRLCSDENCAVSVPNGVIPQVENKYKLTLEIWQGQILDDVSVSSANMEASKIYSKEFTFPITSDRTSFSFNSNEVVVEKNRYIFFVIKTDDKNPYFIDAIGSGDVIWSTGGDGRFDHYYSPYTVPPSSGLFANVYYSAEIMTESAAESDVYELGSSYGTCEEPVNDKVKIFGYEGGDHKGNSYINIRKQDSTTPSFNKKIKQKINICDHDGNAFSPDQLAVSSIYVPISSNFNGSQSLKLSIEVNDGVIATSTAVVVLGSIGVYFNFSPNAVVYSGCEMVLELDESSDDLANVDIGSFNISNTNISTLTSPLLIYNFTDTITNIVTDSFGTRTYLSMATIPYVMFGDFNQKLIDGLNSSTDSNSDDTFIFTSPLKITNLQAQHPRMAKDRKGNIWTVFHSNRSGTDEVYITKYYGDCGQWASSGVGGLDFKLSNAGDNGKTANFANCVCDSFGDVHVVWQSTDTEDGKSEIFYSRSSGQGTVFSRPIRLTITPSSAMVPDISICSLVGGEERIIVVWEDDRFGSYEIMAAIHENGSWQSSGQGKADIRVTAALGDSMFPRVSCDSDGNARICWNDTRLRTASDSIARETTSIYAGSYIGETKEWQCSGQGQNDILITTTGIYKSLFPDVAIDIANGTFIVWQDNRFNGLTNPNKQEEIFGSFASAREAIGSVNCSAMRMINVEGVVYSEIDVVGCQSDEPIFLTNSQDICLKIKAQGVSFYRIANEDGTYSTWRPFIPTDSLDTSIVPWTLSSGNGTKNISIQLQTNNMVGFPVTKTVIFQAISPIFNIQLFLDSDLSIPLPTKNGIPVATRGNVYVKMTVEVPLRQIPSFDVVSGGKVISNQTMEVLDDSVEFDSVVGVSEFKSSFMVLREDGLFNIDGPARIVPHGIDINGNKF